MTKKMQEVLFMSELGEKLGVSKGDIVDFIENTQDIYFKDSVLKDFEWIVFKADTGFKMCSLFDLITTKTNPKKFLVFIETPTDDVNAHMEDLMGKSFSENKTGRMFIITEGYFEIGEDDGETDEKNILN